MNILIVGGNTTNKGAFLMLLAVLEQGRKYIANANFVLPPSLEKMELLEGEEFKVLNFPLFHVGSSPWFNLGMKLPLLTKLYFKLKKKKSLKGNIDLKKIDMVLDISGFAFGDKFGLKPLKNLKKQIDFFKKYNCQYIMMPQALGPFSGDMSSLAKSTLERADLVYARDQYSFDNVTSLGIRNCVQSPDITLCVSSIDSSEINESKKFCTIVPNIRMIEKASQSWKENYEKALLKSIDTILGKSELDILLMIHSASGGGDATLTRRIYEKFKGFKRIKLFQHDNPRILKGVLKKSSFVIGSRFHALASALSSNTPSIGTSWLHKYEALFEEYGIKNFCHNEYDARFIENVEYFLNEENLISTRKKLESSNQLVISKNSEIWKTILRKIESD